MKWLKTQLGFESFQSELMFQSDPHLLAENLGSVSSYVKWILLMEGLPCRWLGE